MVSTVGLQQPESLAHRCSSWCRYYIRVGDIKEVKLENTKESNGFRLSALRVGEKVTEHSIAIFHEGPLSGFDYNAMDGAFEEDDMIIGHPVDPYKRVDIRRSTRDIRVEIGGVVVGESTWAMHLFETGLTTRYYLPRTSIRYAAAEL